MATSTNTVTQRTCFTSFLVIISGCVFTVYGKIVTTNNGQIEGINQTVQVNQQNIIVDAYLGVPFAAPPLGDLRFKAPQEVANWTGVKQTMTQPNCCMQTPDTNFGQFYGVDMWNCKTNISEDCLYLNLWVPRTSSNGDTLTTMVWIYGGSYVYGSSTLDVYDGRYLAARENVIVASMQYRMGVHGFLYTGTDGAPGNVGLRDQQMAMKWVYENIEHFGGDSNKITLFGESAGSASVSYHLIIPSSMPYFTNAIMQSGTFLSHWTYRPAEDELAKARTFASLMNCDNEDMDEILSCLKQADATELEEKQWLLNTTVVATFCIVADGDFLPDSPSNLLQSGNMKDADVLIGTTKDEGEYFLLYSFQDIILPDNLWNPIPLNRSEFKEIASNISGFREGFDLDLLLYVYETSNLPSTRGTYWDILDNMQNLWNPVPLNRSEFKEIASNISGFREGFDLDLLLYVYETSNLPSTRGTYWDILDNMLGDNYFKCAARELALWTSTHRSNHTFVYRFDYINSNNPWPSYLGSLHGYEIETVFGIPFNPNSNYTEEDRKVSADVMKYFTTFAKTGNVNAPSSGLVTWPEFTRDSEEYLVISYNHTVQHGYRTKECTFWSDIVPKLSQHNSDTEDNATTASPD